MQTIKCLLIVPNAESALNEEAGKLLLEEYDQYFQRAQMITEIHAQVKINIHSHLFFSALYFFKVYNMFRKTETKSM